MDSLNTLDIVEQYFGESLTEALICRLSGLPDEQFLPLREALDEEIENWLMRQSFFEEVHGNFAAFYAMNDWLSRSDELHFLGYDSRQQALSRTHRQLLMYAPALVVVDRVSCSRRYTIVGGDPAKGLERTMLPALRWLSSIRHGVSQGYISLVPDSNAIINLPQLRIQYAKFRDPIISEARKNGGLAELGRAEGWAPKFEDEMGIGWYRARQNMPTLFYCHLARLTPCATDGLASAFLGITRRVSSHPRLTSSQSRTTDFLSRFELPGINEKNLSKLLTIRENEDAFIRFRNSLAEVLKNLSVTDDADFEREFFQSAEELLLPRIDELKARTRTTLLEKAIIPGLTSLAIGAVSSEVFGGSAISSILTAAAALGLSWPLEAIRKRATESGIRDVALLRAYTILLCKK